MASITPQELQTKVGEHLGTSDWVLVDQEMINKFADATGDHQFIHVDAEKAKLTPFGGTIAHGFLTLSLIPMLGASTDGPKVGGVKMGVNYGCGKVRFPSPVPVGAKLRLGAELTSVEDIPGGAQVYVTFTYEVEGATKPSCVTEVIFRYYE